MSLFLHHVLYSPDGPVRLRREVVLLTDDRNLRVKALTRNVPVRDIPAFLIWAKVGWSAELTYCCTNQSSSTVKVGDEEIVTQRGWILRGEILQAFCQTDKKKSGVTHQATLQEEMRIFPLQRSVHRQPLTSEGEIDMIGGGWNQLSWFGGWLKARMKKMHARCSCVSERVSACSVRVKSHVLRMSSFQRLGCSQRAYDEARAPVGGGVRRSHLPLQRPMSPWLRFHRFSACLVCSEHDCFKALMIFTCSFKFALHFWLQFGLSGSCFHLGHVV